MQRLCVFCGSNVGRRAPFAVAARALGALLAAERIELVYGGGRVGLMGIVADSVLAAGGRVTGVIPRGLFGAEIVHDGLTDLRVVESMHARKQCMADLADGFIALPGGLGTFEELLEVLTWNQLGIHAKPCGVLNIEGYYDGLLACLDRMVAEQFMPAAHAHLLLHAAEPTALLAQLRAYRPMSMRKWLRTDER